MHMLQLDREGHKIPSTLTRAGRSLAQPGQSSAPDQLLSEIREKIRRALQTRDLQALLEQGARLGDLFGANHRQLTAQAQTTPGTYLSLHLDERLAAVPWELARLGGDFLGEAFLAGRTVTFDPQHSAFAALLQEFGATGPSITRTFSQPRVNVLLVSPEELPWARREVVELRKRLQESPTRFNVELLTDPGRDTLRRHLADADVLHFAGHGESSFTDALRNGWVLNDGIFDSYEVGAAGIDFWPTLVFANCCPTVGDGNRAASTWGSDALAVSLLSRGVSHYICTVSQIEDSRVSVEYALHFYEALFNGQSARASMLRAREALGMTTAARVAACHYILYGDPSVVLFQPTPVAVPPPPAKTDCDATVDGFLYCETVTADDYRTLYLAENTSSDLPKKVWVAEPHDQRPAIVERALPAFVELAASLQGAESVVTILATRVIGGKMVVVYDPPIGHPLSIDAPLTLGSAIDIVVSLARALGGIHARGVFHTQLAPDTILINPDGSVVLQDAGVASVRRAIGLSASFASPEYASPEYGSSTPGWEIGSDLWAMSVIAYRLLCGHHPFESSFRNTGNWHDAMQGQPDALPAGIPAGLVLFFNRAFARAVSERFRTAEAFRAAFERAVRDRGRLGGFIPDLESALDTNTAVLFVATDDEDETVSRLSKVAQRRGCAFAVWSLTSGVGANLAGPEPRLAEGPISVLDWLEAQPDPGMLVLLDYDAFLDDWQLSISGPQRYREFQAAVSADDPFAPGCYVPEYDEQRDRPDPLPALPKAELRRRLINFSDRVRHREISQHKIVIVAPRFIVPEDLGKHVQSFVDTPAGREDVRVILRESGADAENWSELLVWHAAGMTRSAIRGALRLSRVRNGALTADCVRDVMREKAQMARRSGLVEYVEPRYTITADIVGLDLFRVWFDGPYRALTDPALAGSIAPPQGIVLGGLPGTGKTLCAEAIAGELQWPLLRLDVGRIFTGRLGGAEENLRAVLGLVDLMSPVVLLVDDLDRALGMGQSARGGVSGRILNHLLTWLQERSGGAYVVITVSNPFGLPVEVLRAGRFDRVFFFDLPNRAERAALIEFCLRRWERRTDGHDFAALATDTEFLSGAEIAGRVSEALYAAAAINLPDPSPAILRNALTRNQVGDKDRDRIRLQQAEWMLMAVPASLPDSLRDLPAAIPG